jgi:hypothetical protein
MCSKKTTPQNAIEITKKVRGMLLQDVMEEDERDFVESRLRLLEECQFNVQRGNIVVEDFMRKRV